VELLRETSTIRVWLAEQMSISRLVWLDELADDWPETRASFLADARAKAAVEHPLVSSVYEAVAQQGSCFYTHERLNGQTLAERVKSRQPILPLHLAPILRRVAETQMHYETHHQATLPLTLDTIYQDDQGVVRLSNLAIAGPRTPVKSGRDIAHLGHAILPLVAKGQPGTNRLLSLLGWMSGDGSVANLKWSQIRDYCLEVEDQLAHPPLPVAEQAQAAVAPAKKRFLFLLPMLVLAMGIVIIADLISMRSIPALSKSKTPAILARSAEPLEFPAGVHATPDGTDQTLAAFRISPRPVTVAEYAEFLETLGYLALDKRQGFFDATGQPASKPSHEPSDWPALFAAAKASGLWQNQPVTLDSPIVGVDWWDAAAYAEWKKARLPTQEEWFAADRPGGFLREWTAQPAANPADPLGGKSWVLIGSNATKLSTHSLVREWTSDRLLRRPDLGFRIVLEKP
jgi:Sulfatase-modifying factor enzyme 1